MADPPQRLETLLRGFASPMVLLWQLGLRVAVPMDLHAQHALVLAVDVAVAAVPDELADGA